jgi:hypothetical protein
VKALHPPQKFERPPFFERLKSRDLKLRYLSHLQSHHLRTKLHEIHQSVLNLLGGHTDRLMILQACFHVLIKVCQEQLISSKSSTTTLLLSAINSDLYALQYTTWKMMHFFEEGIVIVYSDARLTQLAESSLKSC